MDTAELGLLFLIGCCFHHYATGIVVAVDIFNDTSEFDDLEAMFGSAVGNSGLKGYLLVANPVNACVPIQERPIIDSGIANSTEKFIVLIKRGTCDFALKVLNAQNAKFDAAIVYNDENNALIHMNSNKPEISEQVTIPSVFVGLDTGDLLRDVVYIPHEKLEPYVILEVYSNTFSLKYYLIPFCTVIGTCFLCLLTFMLVRSCQQRRRRRRNRLSRQRLKQLPVKQYTKGDEYDVCAICLDEYEEGEKLRILPCQHAYHCKCVDPWLTSSKRVCPLCKRRVLSDDESSNSEAETDEESSNESAPLLRSSTAASPNASRYATGFSRVNPFSRSYSTSTEESGGDQERYLPLSSNHNDTVEEEIPQISPQFHSPPESTPSTLATLAGVPVPAASAIVPSSLTSSGTLEAYSCESGSTFDGRRDNESDLDQSRVVVLRSGTIDNSVVEPSSKA